MNKNEIKKDLFDLFDMLKRDSTVIRRFEFIRFLLNYIFTDDYLAKEAADELLQKLTDMIADYSKQEDELFNIAKNIIFYNELYKYVTGMDFDSMYYYVTSVFAAICHNLDCEKTESFLEQATKNAFATMRQINEIAIIERLKAICNEHLDKLEGLKAKFEKQNRDIIRKNPNAIFEDKTSSLIRNNDKKIAGIDKRIKILQDMLKSISPSPYFRGAKVLQSRIGAFKVHFKQYQKQVVESKKDAEIYMLDRNFVAKIRHVFHQFSTKIIAFFRKKSDDYEEFASKVERSIAFATT